MSEKTSVGGSASLLNSRRFISFLIAISLISIGAIGYVAANSSTVQSKTLPIAEVGDTVYVNYVGFLADNPGGWVFDTNIRTVGIDPSVVKSLYFWQRSDDQYTPLNFTAGTSTSYLNPFVKAVVGMSTYQTKRIYIPIEEAYSIEESNLQDFSLVMDVPVLQNLTYTEFSGNYKLDPYVGLTVKHKFWGWDTTVIDVLGDKIFLQSHPIVGQIVHGFGNPDIDPRDGWYQEVLSINSSANQGAGLIKVLNLVTPQDAYQKKGMNYDGKTFTLIEVNETQNRFTVIYNTSSPNYIGEIAGRALIFDITVTGVQKQ